MVNIKKKHFNKNEEEFHVVPINLLIQLSLVGINYNLLFIDEVYCIILYLSFIFSNRIFLSIA